MSWLIGAAAFFVVLALDAPFFAAVVLGLVAGAMAHSIRKAQPPAAASAPASSSRNDPEALREELHHLAARVGVLERELATLKGGIQAAPDDPVQPQIKPEPQLQPEPQPEPQPQPRVQEEIPVTPPVQEIPRMEPPVAAPTGPSLLTRLLSGNIVAKVGAVILFFGVGFLLKFAYDHSLFPPEARLAGVALAAAVAFGFGWRLRVTRPLYGVILQGVASGLAYLDTYFALKTYGLIGAPAGFAVFTLLGVGTTLLSLRQDAKPLAVLGLTGAFLAPVLASTGAGSHVLLFSYYLLLNVFIVAVSWFKSWRALNLTGWFFTLAIGAFWGSRSYTPELFGTVEPFLLAFFAIYLVLPILFATRQPPELRGLVDGTLVFGTPAAVAAIQAKLVWGMPYGLAWSAAGGAILYAALALMALRHRNMRLLGETYAALGIALATLAVAFAFGAYTTFALWTIEAAAILWVCLRQNHVLGRWFALAVQAGGAVFFFLQYERYLRFNPYFNDAVLGCAIIAAAAFLSAALYRKYAETITPAERGLAGLAIAWGGFAYSLGVLDVVHHGIADPVARAMVAVGVFAVSTAIAEVIGARMRWDALRRLTTVLPLVLVAAAVWTLARGSHPLAAGGWIAWPVGLGTLFWQLHRQRRDGFDAALDLRYASGWIVLAGLATWEAGWWLEKGEHLYAMAIALVGHAAAALRFRLREAGGTRTFLSTCALLWSMFFWFAAGLGWIERPDAGAQEEVPGYLAFIAATALAYWTAARWLQWPGLRMAAQLPWIALPIATVHGLWRLLEQALAGTVVEHPFAGAWSLGWLFALATAAWILHGDEREERSFAPAWRHGVLLYVPIALATWELLWWLITLDFGTEWQLDGVALPAAVTLIVLSVRRTSPRWPVDAHWPLYHRLLGPIAIALIAWSLLSNLRAPGTLTPLAAYIPLLNPVDAAMAVAAAGVVLWGRRLGDEPLRLALWKALALSGFVWANAVALRSIHYWADVPYRFQALVGSVLVQATLSILWTSSAFALMLVARRRAQRGLWMVGAALLALVVGKLFLVDLSNTGTIARIVSFLGVGVLLLAIGYVAPVPPGSKASEDEP